MKRLESGAASLIFWLAVAAAAIGTVLTCSALLEDAVDLIMEIGG